jgi:hypothetical protein
MNLKKRIYRIAAPVLILFLSAPSGAYAFGVSGQSRTYLQSRETVDSTRLLPLYEYLDFEAGSLGVDNVTFHFGGWYRYDLGKESFGGTKHTGDLQYAYLSYRDRTSNAFLNLGRVLVNQGVASEQVDGLSAGADLKAGFGIAAFGGSPVETALDSRNGDSVYGGRISQGRDGLYRIGLSYLLEKNDREEFRKEEGVDLWLRPIDSAELLGTLLYNAITSDKAQTSLYLTLGPFRNLVLRTQYTDISYKDYFTSTTTSAFQFTPGGPPNPNEQLVLVGEEAALSFGNLNVSVDYKKHKYDLAGNAKNFGATIGYSGSPGLGGGLAYHRMKGETKDLQYNEYRLYAYGTVRKLNVTADALMVAYDREVNGIKNAYSVALAGGYALSPALLAGADVEYAKNPYYDRDVRGLLKLVYTFDLAPARPAPAKAAPAKKGTKGRK